jgi:ATP-dependent DNA helicase
MLTIEDLASWLPPELIIQYRESGIKKLYPPQAEAVERGLLDGRNMLLSIPTAAGKTLLAELAMLKAAFQGRKSLYIVPLRALATEKYESFCRFKDLGIRVGISTGDFDRKDERLGKNTIIIATSEKADSLMRNGASWVHDISVLVVDEIHLLNSANRGPTLEMTITKLRKLNLQMQVIGLSATVANGLELAEWLDAELVTSEWRPINLREGVICDGKLVFPDGEAAIKVERDETLALAKDTLSQNAQILIFESSRRNAEATAAKLASYMGINHPDLAELEESILATGESETCRRLAQCVSRGVAFHHAGLLSEQRKLVEAGFRDNKIMIIASTPTLAAGLNLPARRVLIRSYRRYDSGKGMVPIPVIEYRQMAGRAGRPGLDPYGESFLVAKNKSELQELMEHYVLGTPEEIWSKLASESALRTHLLATITAKFATTTKELKEFIATTFYAHQQEPWHLDVTLERVLDFLMENGMIDEGTGEELKPTPLGSLVSKLYIDPLSAVTMIGHLSDGQKEILKEKRKPSDLTLLHLITMTPDMELLYIQAADRWIEDFIEEHQDDLNLEDNYDFLLREAKTASMLMDWIGEAKEDYISDRYHIGPGDIRRSMETAQWLMHALSELSQHLDLGVTYKAEQLGERIHYGAGADLLAILELKGIGRVRARKLYQEGYTSMDKLKVADPAHIGRILGPKVAERVLVQLINGTQRLDKGES